MTMLRAKSNRLRQSNLISGVMGALAIGVLTLILAAPALAGTAKPVMKDGKKYFEIDGELFPALEPLGPASDSEGQPTDTRRKRVAVEGRPESQVGLLPVLRAGSLWRWKRLVPDLPRPRGGVGVELSDQSQLSRPVSLA